ncbi:hypothetical protein DEU56DRAFT_346648 [Suillus clintonianus]|uniref:uncharacterized protein n=1 Tax=Suillus clintonianus TaxID=1904413 RepID=UPI001B880FB0|nr:uncharacterized protein DEU56DRAFT_346648 [Suillus clintonianus]KAG2137988.1 hypothetical protein DEU56DRAFT_346648 [Suillus clintonianus]
MELAAHFWPCLDKLHKRRRAATHPNSTKHCVCPTPHWAPSVVATVGFDSKRPQWCSNATCNPIAKYTTLVCATTSSPISSKQPATTSHTQHDPSRDSWQSRSNQFDHGRERDAFHDSNSRGGFQRGFRGRGRGRGRWDDRDHDRFKDRDWNSSPQPRNSRSRSPRRFNGQRPRPTV